MLIKQISIFVENKLGRLAEITKLFGEKEINILALSMADTTDFGILRLIVSDADRAENILKECGLTVKATDVIGISVMHVPGGLSKALNALNSNGVSIEYMYAFVSNSKNDAMVIIRVEDNEKALKILKDNDITILSREFVDNM